MTVDRASASGQLAVVLAKAGQLDDLLTPQTMTAQGEETFRQTFRELRTAVADLEAAIGEREQTSTFAEFFSSVGDSLVRAQRALDAHSQTYLQEVTGHPSLLPAVFRIPTLSADIRFGLEKASQDRLNVIFHSRGSEARELNQQSVHFEIIAAPPPPGALDGDAAGQWRPSFVVSPSARAPILAALELAANVADVKAPERKVLKEEVLPNGDGILIVPDDGEV